MGHPRVIDTPIGKAVEFNGVDDALVVDVHPLAGAETFTWEAVFRPDGGQAEQRWFHLQESGSDGAADIHFAGQGPGRASIGVRMNLVNYFKGAIRLARFTRRAVQPSEFLRIPAQG